MTEILKSLISSRGVQLVARGSSIGLTWLAAKAGATVDPAQAEGFNSVVGLLVCAGACLLVDFISHKFQKDDAAK
jgi:hypothetical protein